MPAAGAPLINGGKHAEDSLLRRGPGPHTPAEHTRTGRGRDLRARRAGPLPQRGVRPMARRDPGETPRHLLPQPASAAPAPLPARPRRPALPPRLLPEGRHLGALRPPPDPYRGDPARRGHVARGRRALLGPRPRTPRPRVRRARPDRDDRRRRAPPRHAPPEDRVEPAGAGDPRRPGAGPPPQGPRPAAESVRLPPGPGGPRAARRTRQRPARAGLRRPLRGLRAVRPDRRGRRDRRGGPAGAGRPDPGRIRGTRCRGAVSRCRGRGARRSGRTARARSSRRRCRRSRGGRRC